MKGHAIRADLHVHSRHSDGSLSVKELISEAADKGLTAISLTDHDTVSSLSEALVWGIRMGVDVIPGVEISAWDSRKKRKIHLLGYDFDSKAPHLRTLCTPLLRRRHENTVRQVNILREAGYPLTLEEVWEEAGEAPHLYKQHIMALFMKKGLTDGIYSPLYKELFKGEGICRGDIDYVDVFDALEAIKADRGVAVLAHPGQQDSFDLIPPLVRRGLWGVELNHEDNSEDEKERLTSLAQEFGLALTGGSDTHGAYGSDHALGDITAPANLSLPLERSTCPPRAKGEGIPRLESARRIVEECARFLREEVNQTPEGEWKNGDHSDLVTRYDREVERRLVEALSEKFPRDRFLTEEEDRGTDISRGVVWIIDPIDGTTNFVHRRKDYAISVACWREGKPCFGLVKDPAGGDLFEGIAGQGARLNGSPLPLLTPKESLKESLVDFSMNSAYLVKRDYGADLSELAPLICGHRAYGAASLILCQIAQGTCQIYLSAHLSLWDYAAAGIILRETGGSYREGKLLNREKGLRSGRFFLAWGSENPGGEMDDFLEGQGVSREIREG